MKNESHTSLVMDAETIRRALRRIAHEIVERNPDPSQLIIAGIPTRGVEVARRLVAHIAQIEGVTPEFGIVDVSMHRDDLALRGRPTAVVPTQLPVDIDGRILVLVDDVLFTGRSCRAALDAVASFGRPSQIQYAVLVDRGHRELPIRPDYVGKNLPTAREEKIRVRFASLDGVADSVSLCAPEKS
ncbi:MAG TPA: bifunctional pyr operon transcriptional regulator/uracil phosphoribosyltransferase PyrR [Terrimicrobiaceae bacterium]|nr:bifunctional pyr operon transcriptional regulator/uracil phosphoribosyltransferase PyrR [Terrimicrobiaceae bacterium]